MRRFIGLLAVLLALMLLSTSVALAQDMEQEKVVFCGELSNADCLLLNESETALWTLTSGESAKVTRVYLGGFDRLESLGPTVEVSNRSMFVADQAVIDQMSALHGVDVEELALDQDALLEALLLPLSLDTASVTTLKLSPELRAMLSRTLNQGVPAEFTYETRLIDGVMYINVGPFAEIVPEAASLGEWIGIDMMAFVPDNTANQLASGELDMEEIAERFVDAIEPPGKSMMVQPYLVKIEPGQEDVFNGFLEILPLRDTSIDGQIVAVYRMKMDLSDYVSSEAFADRLFGATTSSDSGLYEELGESGGGEVATSIVQGLLSFIARNNAALALQGIGYEDAFLYGMEMQFGLEIAGKRVDVEIQAGNANMNAVESVPVPEDAFVPPIRLIMGLIDTFRSE